MVIKLASYPHESRRHDCYRAVISLPLPRYGRASKRLCRKCSSACNLNFLSYSHQIIEATTTTEDSKPAFEAEFSPDLTHPNVVQTFKASSVPITVRHYLVSIALSTTRCPEVP